MLEGWKEWSETRTASSWGIPVINGSILHATVNRSSLNRERGCNLHRKIERVQARPIKDERRRRMSVSVDGCTLPGRENRSITIETSRPTFEQDNQKFIDWPLIRWRFFSKIPKTWRFYVYCKISMCHGRCPFAVPNLRQCLSV